MKREFIVCALLLGGGAAHASFTLLLATDSVNNRVTRYDGDTGANLGSFGQLQASGSFWGITANRTTKKAYVSQTNGRVLIFDYNTGEYSGNFETGQQWGGLTLGSTGNIVASSYLNSDIKVFNAAGTLLSTLTPSGYLTVSGAVEIGGNYYFIGYHGPSGIHHFVRTNSAGAVIASTSLGSSSYNDIHQATTSGTNIYFSGGNTNAVLRASTSLAVPTSMSQGGDSPRVYGVAMGHGTTAYSSATVLAGSRITLFDRSTGVLMGQIPTNGAGQVAAIIAPEPTTLVGLTVAALAGIRRRRQRKA